MKHGNGSNISTELNFNQKVRRNSFRVFIMDCSVLKNLALLKVFTVFEQCSTDDGKQRIQAFSNLPLEKWDECRLRAVSTKKIFSC